MDAVSCIDFGVRPHELNFQRATSPRTWLNRVSFSDDLLTATCARPSMS